MNDNYLEIEDDFLQTIKQEKSKKKKKKPVIKSISTAHSEGKVVTIFKARAVVLSQGIEYNCTYKHYLEQFNGDKTTIIAVGDNVVFHITSHNEGVIESVKTRTSILERMEHSHRRKKQIIATNIDQVVVCMSLFYPPLKLSLIDRYIISARSGNMTPLIVVTKYDLFECDDIDEKEKQAQTNLYNSLLSIYQSLNIPVITVVSFEKEAKELLMPYLNGKSSLFSGQSGVGKTTLVNTLYGSDFKTAEVIVRKRKGAHTTSRTTLIQLNQESFFVDTPGIKSFGLPPLDKNILTQYFDEIHSIGETCQYGSCSHSHEPNCAVKQSVENGTISQLRYDSFIELYKELSS